MLKTIASKLVCTLVICAFLSANALACACCSEPGSYAVHTGKPDSYYLDLVSGFKYSKAADIYMTEAGYDTIKGLDAFRKEDEESDYTMSPALGLASASLSKKAFLFEFKTPKGLAGSISMPLPPQMTSFAADIHDNDDRGLGPLLYKEFRFKGNVSFADGFLRTSAARGTKYFLVFQGRGRGCNEVSDFMHWRLEVTGPKADYAFYGKLESGGATAKDRKNDGRKDAGLHLDTSAGK